MRIALLVTSLAAILASQLSAQITVSAQAAGSGVSLFNGAFQAAPGTDITAGYQQTLGNFSNGGTGSFDIVQSAGSVAATLSSSSTAQGFSASNSSARVQISMTSQTPMLVDVSLTMLSEFAPFCRQAQAQLTSGRASAQLVGFAPLTNEHCNVSIFGPPCTFTFEPMQLDANGLTFEMVADAVASWTSRCVGPQTARFSCAIEVRPSAVVEPFGMACGADLTAQTSFATPGLFDIEIQDPGASVAVLLVGVDQIALPFLGCTLLTTPVASVPLMLDASGAWRSASGCRSRRSRSRR